MDKSMVRCTLVLFLSACLWSSAVLSGQGSKGILGRQDATKLSAAIFGPFEIDPLRHRLVILVTASCLTPSDDGNNGGAGVRYIEVILTNAVSGDELLRTLRPLPGARLEVATSAHCELSASRCEILVNGRSTGRFIIPDQRLPIVARVAAEIALRSPPGPGRCANANIATSLQVTDRRD